jgi:Cu(I)/Ag(I) efflux system protein CusF
MKLWIASLTLLLSSAAMAQTADMTTGVVRKIDTENGKVTLKHSPIKNLDMPGMTMVFRVKETKLLEGLKAGDSVAFTAENVDGAITILTLQATPTK